jgi:chromosome segregation ATPase
VLETLEADKFDMTMRRFLRKSRKILVERDVYEGIEQEKEQAIADREVLGEEIIGLGEKLREKEGEIRSLEERYKELEREIGEEREQNEESQKRLKEYEEKNVGVDQVVERANRIIGEIVGK